MMVKSIRMRRGIKIKVTEQGKFECESVLIYRESMLGLPITMKILVNTGMLTVFRRDSDYI